MAARIDPRAWSLALRALEGQLPKHRMARTVAKRALRHAWRDA